MTAPREPIGWFEGPLHDRVGGQGLLMKNRNCTVRNVLGFSGWVGFFLESKQRLYQRLPDPESCCTLNF